MASLDNFMQDEGEVIERIHQMENDFQESFLSNKKNWAILWNIYYVYL